MELAEIVLIVSSTYLNLQVKTKKYRSSVSVAQITIIVILAEQYIIIIICHKLIHV